MYIYPKTKLILHMHIGLGLEFFGHIGLRLKKIQHFGLWLKHFLTIWLGVGVKYQYDPFDIQ
jgi:hypothetical protein